MRGVASALCFVLVTGLGASTTAGAVYGPAVTTLEDHAALMKALRDRDAQELPVEALGIYIQGIDAWHAGDIQTAVASMDLATELDPSFPEPHLAQARLLLFRNPAGAAAALGAGVRAALSSFLEQQRALANLFLSGFTFLVFGFLVLVAYAVFQHVSRLHHATSEIVAPRFPGRLAGLCAVLLFFVPVLWRIGGLPLAFLAAGVLWPWMPVGQRRWIGALGAGVLLSPFVLWALSPFLLGPLDPAGLPFLLARANGAASTPELIASLEDAQHAHPKENGLSFALAALQKRAGNYAAAQRLYQKALDEGASPAMVQNNLAVVAFLEGNYDRALDLLQRSIANDPDRVAAHFNLSQTYSKKLFFEKADQELRLANHLSIDRVRRALRAAGGEARRTLIDEVVPARAIWASAAAEPRRMPGLPASMDVWFRGSLWLLPGLAVICFSVALRLGRQLHRHLPAMACANCGRPICRRCLKRIRQEAYCGPCGEILLRIQSASYSKLVLDTQIRRKRRTVTVLLRVTSWLFPGLYAARRGRDALAAILALVSTMSLVALLQGPLPVRRLVWLDGLPTPWWPEVPALALGLALAVSLFTVVKLKPVPIRARALTPYGDAKPGQRAA
jgi:tetratricopeptide (TPR) repeat protein